VVVKRLLLLLFERETCLGERCCCYVCHVLVSSAVQVGCLIMRSGAVAAGDLYMACPGLPQTCLVCLSLVSAAGRCAANLVLQCCAKVFG